MKSRSLVALLAMVLIALPVVASADDAAAVYKAKCAMCHGPDGAGQTPTGKAMKVRDLSSPDVQKATDEQIEKMIENGKGKMPAYKGKLDAAAIDGLVKFVRTLAKK